MFSLAIDPVFATITANTNTSNQAVVCEGLERKKRVGEKKKTQKKTVASCVCVVATTRIGPWRADAVVASRRDATRRDENGSRKVCEKIRAPTAIRVVF
jgi:hypothetical protein